MEDGESNGTKSYLRKKLKLWIILYTTYRIWYESRMRIGCRRQGIR